VVVIGAGPAGLTAAYELVRHGVRPTVIERGRQAGGLARTEVYRGYRFDIGGHRFFTTEPEVQALWEHVLGDELLTVPRLSRIYYNGRFFHYPLSLLNVVRNLGALESARCLASYVRARLAPPGREETFEDWVTARFGRRLYETFFKNYTEKVWGIPCSEIRADWASQRIKDLSLTAAVAHALFGRGKARSLIHQFRYPRLGPGQMWERFRELVVRGGGRVWLGTAVESVHRRGRRVVAVTVRRGGRRRTVPAAHVISSMPIGRLVRCLEPAAPAHVREAADGLKYRDFLIVALIINRAHLFPDNWIYVHTPRVRVGRIQNFKNWSPAMVPDPNKTCLGMEYFCNRDDDLWRMEDAQLMHLAMREAEALGLANSSDVEDAYIVRQPKAYPVYDGDYRRHLDVLKAYLARFSNLQPAGRNGLHRYNNQDHSMLCGLYAARNVLGANYDLWEVNTERSYQEEQRVEKPARHGRAAAPAAAGALDTG
jgi:protoporphyrinogen oxidase